MKDKIDNIEEKVGALKVTVIVSIYNDLPYVVQVNLGERDILSIDPDSGRCVDLPIPIAGPNSDRSQVLQFIIFSSKPLHIWLFQDAMSNVVKYYIGDVFKYNLAIPVKGNSLSGGNLKFTSSDKNLSDIILTMF
ncbi:hypothetical protein C6H68_08280 [Photorhabdus luminescens]|nr:hypothetical protein C6H68_08280 [Photorhabdus luminescens]